MYVLLVLENTAMRFLIQVIKAFTEAEICESDWEKYAGDSTLSLPHRHLQVPVSVLIRSSNSPGRLSEISGFQTGPGGLGGIPNAQGPELPEVLKKKFLFSLNIFKLPHLKPLLDNVLIKYLSLSLRKATLRE